MAAELQLTIANNFADLQRGIAELESFLEDQQASMKLCYAAQLVFEEMLTNIIKYGYDDTAAHQIQVQLSLAAPPTMLICDDGHRFDPRHDAPVPDLDAAIEDRQIGGLGIHMVCNLAAAVDYQRREGRNLLTVTLPQ